MPDFLKRNVDALYGSWLDFRAGLRERPRWRVPPRSGGVHVFYGHDRIPTRGERVSGGIIKLQDLEAAHPNTTLGANILYLVSSALPRGAVAMARLARRRGVRLVVNQNGVAYPAWHGPGWKRANAPLALLLRMADHVFYQSEFCKRSADRFLGARVGFGDILHNPVDTRVFVPVATRLPGPPTLLLAGSHQHAYRVRAALETLRHLSAHFPEARLLVAGRYAWKGPREAEARGEAEAMAHELGVRCRVEIRGAYTQEESPALLQSAHVLLHTKYNDPCPRLVVEAMACGLPVAFSASGGVPELVGDEAGIGVPAPLDWDRDHPPAPAALAAAAARVINDLARYSQAARRRATQRFDVTAWVQRHTEVFRRLAGGS